MTRQPGRPSADESTPIAVALLGDDEWTATVAADLETVDRRLETTRFASVVEVVSATDDVDCVVAGPELDAETTVALCRRVADERPATAVVEAVDPDCSPNDRADGPPRPTAVHVGDGDGARPAALAWRVRAAVHTVALDRKIAVVQEGLDALFAEVPTPLAITGADGTVELTNAPYKAKFGLAARLPASLPDAPPEDRVEVTCETLDGQASFRYSTVRLDAERVCHVFRDRPEESAATRDDGESSTGPAPPASETGDEPLAPLTDRQREVLECAYRGGFFERPKTANSDELAADLGITRSTFLQHLRAAQRKLLAELLSVPDNGGT